MFAHIDDQSQQVWCVYDIILRQFLVQGYLNGPNLHQCYVTSMYKTHENEIGLFSITLTFTIVC